MEFCRSVVYFTREKGKPNIINVLGDEGATFEIDRIS